ncbi:MAG: DUF6089 family protein [Bacteroidota bacterium]
MKKSKGWKIVLLTCIALTGLQYLHAQQKGWEAGVWLGTSAYFGDLNTSYNLSSLGPAGGVLARYNFNKRVSFKAGINYGRIEADDALSKNQFERARNLSFRSDIFELSTQLEFNFLPYEHGSNDEFFTPYVFGGFTLFNYNPQAELDGVWYDLREMGTEGQFLGEEYFSFSGSLLYGVGLKFDLSYEWSINIELGARQLFTDYVDDVSTVYPDFEDLEQLRGDIAVQLSDRSISIPSVVDPNINQEGRQRGDSSTNDSYVMLGIGILYYFGGINCPEYGR